MKTLVHRIPISLAAPVSLADLKEHFRVDQNATHEDLSIAGMGLSAAREIENFAQIALLTQTIRVTIIDPPREYGMRLPIGPVAQDQVPIVTIDGEPFTGFAFEPGKRPYIRWLSAYSDLQPARMMIEYEAGFGSSASAIPKDLALAIKDQALSYFDVRGTPAASVPTASPLLGRVSARYRGVQV